MDSSAFLSIRLPRDIRNRLKALAAARGENLQDLVGNLIVEHLAQAESQARVPDLTDTLRRLRTIEPQLTGQGVAHLWIFGSVARGEATPESDTDIAVAFGPNVRTPLFAITHAKELIAGTIGHKVDIVERSVLKPDIAASLQQDMVAVF
jgi:predicted nucleotidyltransferase